MPWLAVREAVLSLLYLKTETAADYKSHSMNHHHIIKILSQNDNNFSSPPVLFVFQIFPVYSRDVSPIRDFFPEKALYNDRDFSQSSPRGVILLLQSSSVFPGG